ncbi:conjugal transfer protein [Isobaculum melis]|uniref:TcpE family protein n=1 Tax=Isobaculum melis TaxID=142588 RepID=A0A1H9TPR3_9LACT|nr:conjugal transfer protein [Isobaculum melis]SER99111.1 TcpE family protein [Isobaculum melis]
MNIKVFTKIWNVEKVLYKISDFNLPFVLTFSQIKYLLTTFMFMLMFGEKIPIPLLKNGVIKNIAVSIGIMMFLSNVKLDGKKPMSFLKSFFKYMFRGKSSCKGKPVKLKKYTWDETITVVRRLDHVSN